MCLDLPLQCVMHISNALYSLRPLKGAVMRRGGGFDLSSAVSGHKRCSLLTVIDVTADFIDAERRDRERGVSCWN